MSCSTFPTLSRMLFLMAMFASSADVFAQTSQTPASAEAEEKRNRLFKEGKAAADAGQWAEASAKFKQVVAIRSAPKALIALGVAEERLGHLLSALSAYKQAREEAADKTLTDELKTANSALETLRPRIPKLTFSPPEALEGATVSLDSAKVALTNGTLSVDPGNHNVAVASPKGSYQTTVTAREGDSQTITIAFGGPSSPLPTSTSSAGSADSGSKAPPTGALILGVPGLALIAAGTGLYGVGSSQYNEAKKTCPGPACSKEVLATGNDARGQMIAGDVLIGVGAAAVAGAAVWWIVSATSAKKKPQTGFFIAPRGPGIEIGGQF